jgi:hypothetical protein
MRITASILTLTLVVACGGDLTLPGGPSGVAEPDRLRIVDGDGQRAQTGELLDNPLVIEVVDSGQAPVPGTPVEFRFVGDPAGAVLEPASALTDSTGQASAFVRLGLESGEQEIVARVTGTASPDLSASFTATALADKGKGGKGEGNGGHDGDEGD